MLCIIFSIDNLQIMLVAYPHETHQCLFYQHTEQYGIPHLSKALEDFCS